MSSNLILLFFFTPIGSLCLVTAGFGAFVAATVMGWSSPMTEKLQEEDDNPLGRPITRNENSWLASISILGICFGCIVVGILASHFGRKTILIWTGVIHFIFYVVMAYAQSIRVLYLGRFMTGSGAGAVISILPLYYAEISEAEYRGMISTTMTVFLKGGSLYSLILAPRLPYFPFHISLVVLSAFFTVTLWLFLPESPYILIKADRLEAKKILLKMKTYKNVDVTLDQMEASSRSNDIVSLREIIQSKATIKTLIIGLGGFTFTQLTGTCIILSYGETLLKKAGSSFRPEDGPVIITIVQFVASMIFPVYADKFSRKSLLIFSHAGIALAQIPLGIYFHFKFQNYSMNGLSWCPLALMTFISTLYTVGVSPVLSTILGEIFPPRIKEAVVSWMIAYNMGGAFFIILLYNTLEDVIGIDYLLWIASFFGFLAVLFMRYFVFETRGKTLQEIQEELTSTKQ